MSEPTNTTRRREQAEHIVNSLKLKSSKFHLTGSKKLKKNKKAIPVRKDSRPYESTLQQQIPQGPWFQEDDGRIKGVQFVVGKPAPPTAQSSNTFSSMFKQLAMKFITTPTVPDSVYSKVFHDGQSGRVYLANSKDGESQLEIFKPTSQAKESHGFGALIAKVDIDELKVQYNLGYLY